MNSATHFSVNAPPYPVPPYQYRDNEMFTLKFEVERDYLRELVPEPLEVAADNILAVYVGYLHVVEPTTISYGEAGIMIPARLGDRHGTYMPVLYLDEVELLTSGREVWGFPKRRGEVIFERRDNSVSAQVRDGDTAIIAMDMTFGRPGAPLPVYEREHFLLKSIPSVTGNGHDVRQIATCRVRNDERKEIWEGQANFALQSTPRNPLGAIPVRRLVSSVYTVGDILLDHGEVLHDYLAC